MEFQPPPPLQTVTQAVNLLGYEHINPESLMALDEALKNGDFGPNAHVVRRAYFTVMAGFRALFAPVEAA